MRSADDPTPEVPRVLPLLPPSGPWEGGMTRPADLSPHLAGRVYTSKALRRARRRARIRTGLARWAGGAGLLAVGWSAGLALLVAALIGLVLTR